MRNAGGNVIQSPHFHDALTVVVTNRDFFMIKIHLNLQQNIYINGLPTKNRAGNPEKWAQKIHPSGGGAPAVYRVYKCQRYRCKIKSFRKATVYKRDSLLCRRPRVCSRLDMCVGTRGAFLRFAARLGRYRSRCTALPCTRILGY